MILDILLIVLVAIELVFIGIMQYLHAKERKDMIRAIIAKNMDQITTAEAIDKMPKEEEKPPDEIPVNADNPDLFDKMIAAQNKLTSK